MKRLLLVICALSWNDAHATESMLRALQAERFVARARGVRVSVIAYDNGSTDGTARHLEAGRRRGIIDELILSAENIGNSISRNLMIDWALERGSDAIAFVDGDVIPTVGALTAFTKELACSSATVGSIGADYFSRAQTTTARRSTLFKLRVRHKDCRVINSIGLTQFGV
jgi:glycosyltransferase involved in cell wall biosynthesis